MSPKVNINNGRLQEHLVKAEETHTEDYLLATRSEQDLRAEVAGLREQILTANQSLDSVRFVVGVGNTLTYNLNIFRSVIKPDNFIQPLTLVS